MELNLAKLHERIAAYGEEHRKSPRRYRAKVVFVALLGYAFFFAAFLGNLGLLGLLVFAHLWFGGNWLIYAGYLSCGLMLGSFVRSALVPIPPPPGIEISPSDFPYLYKVIDSLRHQLKAGRKEIRILVDWNYNAFAVTRPKFGIIGPAVRYVGIGLPLLASLNQEQTRAVIAHEMAHFSPKHTRMSSRLCRLELIWTALLHRIRTMPLSGLPYRFFVDRYSRWLTSLEIVVRRSDEFEADRVAAEAVGKRAVAEGLLRIALRSTLVVDRHWKDTWQIALVTDQPARFPVSRLFDRLGRTIDRESAIPELRWILGTATEIGDSHPSCAERIAALGFEIPRHDSDLAAWLAEWPVLRPDSILKQFIGQQIAVASSLDEIWRVVNREEWQMLHAESQPLVRQMTQLDREWKESGRLSVGKAWKHAEITARFHGVESIVPIADYVLRLDPEHTHANFTKGCDLLRNYDPLGVSLVEKAMKADPLSYSEAGLAVLSDHFRRTGASADAIESKYQSFSAADETVLALKERAVGVSSGDSFLPHDLSPEVVADVCRCFEEVRSIRRVYVVRRVVTHLPESSCYVFAFATRWGRNPFSGRGGAHLSVGIVFSRFYIPVILGFSSFRLRRKISQVPGALIHRKPTFRASKQSDLKGN